MKTQRTVSIKSSKSLALKKAKPASRRKQQSSKNKTKRSSKPLSTKKNQKSKVSAAKKVLKPFGRLLIRKRKKEVGGSPLKKELPYSYNETKMVLLPRDPEWGYAYWDFSGETWRWIQGLIAQDKSCSAKLRIHNLDEKTSYDLDVHLDAKNWYIHFGLPNTSFEAELGLLDSSGRFHSIIRSNRIKTPRSHPSDKIDPDWNPADVGWDDIYRLSGGELVGRSSASMFSPVKKRN